MPRRKMTGCREEAIKPARCRPSGFDVQATLLCLGDVSFVPRRLRPARLAGIVAVTFGRLALLCWRTRIGRDDGTNSAHRAAFARAWLAHG
jgi:hypothetical protein